MTHWKCISRPSCGGTADAFPGSSGVHLVGTATCGTTVTLPSSTCVPFAAPDHRGTGVKSPPSSIRTVHSVINSSWLINSLHSHNIHTGVCSIFLRVDKSTNYIHKPRALSSHNRHRNNILRLTYLRDTRRETNHVESLAE